MDNAVSQCHAGTTAGCDSDRVHAAAEEQAPGFGSLAEQKRSVWGKALGAVEQHANFRIGEAGETMQRVFQHRFEVIPVFG